jgi:hypothetical protein
MVHRAEVRRCATCTRPKPCTYWRARYVMIEEPGVVLNCPGYRKQTKEETR